MRFSLMAIPARKPAAQRRFDRHPNCLAVDSDHRAGELCCRSANAASSAIHETRPNDTASSIPNARYFPVDGVTLAVAAAVALLCPGELHVGIPRSIADPSS